MRTVISCDYARDLGPLESTKETAPRCANSRGHGRTEEVFDMASIARSPLGCARGYAECR